MVGGKVRGKSKLLFLLVIITFLLIIISSSVFADSCTSNKIALLGDSITVGWGPKFIQSCGNQPLNFASGGKWTEWMLNKLQSDIIGKGYTHLVILGGTNDIWNQKNGKDYTPTETITSNLAQIYALAKQNNIKVIAGTIPPFTNKGGPQKNEQVKEINNWIKSQLGTNVDQVVDFYGLLIGQEPCIKTEYAKNCNDVHPNDVGYKVMADKVVNEVFGGQTTTGQAVGTSLTTSAQVPEFKTMLILGSHDSGTRVNRVNEAYKLIQQGNFEYIIVSGGCGAHDTAADNCEADHMFRLLMEKGVSANKIILEEKSGSTSGNYKYSKQLTLPQTTGIKVINPNDKLLVVSSSDNVKAVAYCFRYKDQVDAYYVRVPNSYTPAVVPANYDGGSYSGMVNNCRPSGQQATLQQQPPVQPQPPSQQGQYQITLVPKVVLGCKNGQRCQEMDQVWSERLGPLLGKGNLIFDHNTGTLANYKTTYFDERQVPTTGSLSGYPSGTYNPGQVTPGTGGGAATSGGGAISTSNLIGPTVWCTGNEGLPSQTYQNRIQKTAWYPGGSDTLFQLAISVGNSKGVHPALLTTHMVYESSMKIGPSCTDDTGTQRSSLTGCGWSGGENGCAATPCGCKKKSTESDKTQLECTTSVDKGAYLQALGRKEETNCGNKCYYAKCDAHKNDPDKMWKCILCIYQGDYNKIITQSSGTTYFTRDGTCKYAEDFKNTYCSWENYFAQKGFSPPPTTTTSTGPYQGTYTGGQAHVKDPNCLILYGDTRNPESRQKIALKSIKEECANPSLFHVGDFVGKGDRKDHWKKFLNYERDLIKQGTLYAIVGNHEDMGAYNGKGHQAIADNLGDEFPYIRNQMSNGGHYTVPITSNLIAIILNTEGNCNSETQFLTQQLNANPNMGVMLGFHKPAYPHIARVHGTGCAKKWHKLLVEHKNKGNKVLAFAGHTHGLARVIRGGVTHLEVGAMLNPRSCLPTQGSVFCLQTRGYYRCDANLHCVAKDENGNTLDQFNI